MAKAEMNGSIVRFRREPTFQSYVSLFEQNDSNSTNAETEQQATQNVRSDTLRSSGLAENGWMIVSASDPVLSLTATDSNDSSVTSSTMTGCGSGSRKRRGCIDNTHQLCGYLNKYKVGARSVSRNFKRRWFVLADSSCKLLYYRTASDQIPLGEVDVAHCVLSFNATDDVYSNVFEIRTSEKTYLLQADDRHTMHYWLQELQMRRKLFHKLKMQASVPQGGDGLLKSATDSDDELESDELSGLPFVENIAAPPKTIGPTAAAAGRRYNIRDISVVNWKTEIKNMIAGLKSSPLRDSELASPEERPGCDEAERVGSVRKITSPGMSSRLKNFIWQKRTATIGDGLSQASCQRCKHLEDVLKTSQDDARTIEDELTATHELVKTLQKQLDKLQRQLDTQQTVARNESEESYRELLRQKDIYTVELEHFVSSLQETLSKEASENDLLKAELASAREDISVYEENLHVKDGIVKNLTKRLDELEPSTEPSARSSPGAVRKWNELELVKDQCDAYRIQNAFLNKEIMALGQIMQDEESEVDRLRTQLNSTEAEHLRLKSKYLYCLKEMSKPQFGSDGYNTEVVSQLLQDAINDELSLDCNNRTSYISERSDRYDQYGFGQASFDNDDVHSLMQTLVIKSDQLSQANSDQDVSRWEKFLISCKDKPLQPSVELKQMLRDGVSLQFRSYIWKLCIDMHVKHLRHCCGPNYYTNLVDRVNCSDAVVPARHQIQLDLLRTLPNNQYYENENSDGIPRLSNVLLAFSLHKPDVGYCQGMNRLAAILLLFLREEEAFWGLVAIIESLMPPKYYDRTLIAAHADQRVLKELVAEKLPQLDAHFAALQCDMSMFTFNWFLVLFVDNLPVETYLRVWDAFLYEGSKVLFRYALAILKHCEPELLSMKNNTDLNNFLRNIVEKLGNVNRLSQIAFHELNPFPKKTIEMKRQFHLQKLQVEFSELAALRDTLERSITMSMHELEARDTNSEEE